MKNDVQIKEYLSSLPQEQEWNAEAIDQFIRWLHNNEMKSHVYENISCPVFGCVERFPLYVEQERAQDFMPIRMQMIRHFTAAHQFRDIAKQLAWQTVRGYM